MKRKLLYLVLLSISVNSVLSQNYCLKGSWNWWSDDSQNNWTFYSKTGDVNTMGSIWIGSASVTSVKNILLSEDYTPRNGWILIYRNFGCINGSKAAINHPYFILYNKYRAKLRLFILFYDLNYGNGAVATLRWADGNKTTSLLTHASGLSKVNSAYHTGLPISSDVSTFAVDHNSNSFYYDKWFIADFDVAFDNQTPTNAWDYQLSIDVSAVQNSDVHLTGTTDLITEPYSSNSPSIPTTDPTGKSVKDYLTDARKVTKSFPSESDLKKVFGDQNKELLKYQANTEFSFGNTKFSTKYEANMTELSQGLSFVNFLTGVSKYAPIVGQFIDVAIGAFDFFSSKPNVAPSKVIVMPTVTHGSLSLSGTIRTENPIEPITFGLPGTQQSIKTYEPYYNCPLGVIGLEKEPPISIRRWVETKPKYSKGVLTKNLYRCSLESMNPTTYSCKSNGSKTINTYSITENVTEKWKSIKIGDNITNEYLKVALNSKADVEIESIKVALVGLVRLNDDPKNPKALYNLIDKSPIFDNDKNYQIDVHDVYGGNCIDCRVDFSGISSSGRDINDRQWYNKTLNYLNNNFYLLTNLNSNTGSFEFSTPFVDIQNLNGLSFTVREETDVYLKFFATLKAKDPEVSTTPIVFAAKYILTEPTSESDNIDEPYAFSEAQLSYLDIADNSREKTTLNASVISSGLYKNWDISTNGTVLADANNGNVEIDAYHKVTLSPGFSAKPTGSNFIKIGITTDTKVIPKNNTNISTLVTTYFSDCNSTTLKSARLEESNSFNNLIQNAEESVSDLFSPSVYPNPTDGNIIIYGLPACDEPTTIQVFNVMGKLISSDKILTEKYFLDLLNQPKGLFLIKLSYKNQVKLFKVIKTN